MEGKKQNEKICLERLELGPSSVEDVHSTVHLLDYSNLNSFVSQFTSSEWQIASMRRHFGVLNSVLKLKFHELRLVKIENGGSTLGITAVCSYSTRRNEHTKFCIQVAKTNVYERPFINGTGML